MMTDEKYWIHFCRASHIFHRYRVNSDESGYATKLTGVKCVALVFTNAQRREENGRCSLNIVSIVHGTSFLFVSIVISYFDILVGRINFSRTIR